MCASAILSQLLAGNRNSEIRPRKGLRQDLYGPPRLLPRGRRAEDRNCGRLAAPACAAGQTTGHQVSRNSICCRRNARREGKNVLRSFAEYFTGKAVHNLSRCSTLGVTRTRFRGRFDATLRTANRSSQLDVAWAERRVRRSSWRKRKDSLSRRPSVPDVSVMNAVEGALATV